MTPTDFRAALTALGMTQAAFARFLVAHGHPATDVARSVRRWATEAGPPGEVVVILAMLRNQPDAHECRLALRELLSVTPVLPEAAKQIVGTEDRYLAAVAEAQRRLR